MKRLVFFLLLTGILLKGFSQQDGSLKLWYNTPSGDTWENALPIGNGRLGAMVYGNVENETIQLNEHTIWTGSPNRKKVVRARPQKRAKLQIFSFVKPVVASMMISSLLLL